MPKRQALVSSFFCPQPSEASEGKHLFCFIHSLWRETPLENTGNGISTILNFKIFWGSIPQAPLLTWASGLACTVAYYLLSAIYMYFAKYWQPWYGWLVCAEKSEMCLNWIPPAHYIGHSLFAAAFLIPVSSCSPWNVRDFISNLKQDNKYTVNKDTV